MTSTKKGQKKQNVIGTGILIGVLAAHLGGLTAPVVSAVAKAKSALRKKGPKAPCCKCACPACPGSVK